jgi:hypothetical protein
MMPGASTGAKKDSFLEEKEAAITVVQEETGL